jgi:hypothetical protein
MNRLLVADALGIKPASSDFKYLLSSSRQYGLTEGTEKAENVSLTPLGLDATGTDQVKRKKALRKAVMAPALFSEFFTTYNGNKVPSDSMLPKLLVSDFEVPESKADEAAELLLDNGKRVGLIRDISGSPHIILEGDDWEEPEPEAATPPEDGEGEVHESDTDMKKAKRSTLQRSHTRHRPTRSRKRSSSATGRRRARSRSWRSC